MKTLAVLATSLCLLACSAPRAQVPAAAPDKGSMRLFQRREVSGSNVFSVTLRATGRVSSGMLDLLEKELTIRRVDSTQPEELRFWLERPLPLRADRAEVQIELVPSESGVDVRSFVYGWPEIFRISRPGVLEVVPAYENLQTQATKSDDGVGVIRQALEAPTVVRGRILCKGAPARQLSVVVAGKKAQTEPDGTFEITDTFTGVPTRVYVAYEANIALTPLTGAPISPRLQVFNDFHDTRNESVDQAPTVNAGVAAFGDVALGGNDCVLWNLGVEALTHYASTLGTAPPAGELRIKRWEAVYMSAGAGPHTFYDYIVAPTDLAIDGDRTRIFFHEFGHSIRHVADGSETHWHGDDFAFIYARKHNGSQVTNKSFVFNEGWGHYWSRSVTGVPRSVHPEAPSNAFLDWNEDRIAKYLERMSDAIVPPPSNLGARFMARVLIQSPGNIHTLWQFEQRYCAALDPHARNPFCRDGVPTRPQPASCPSGYSDDGATCRLNNILAKPSFGRGAGVVPNGCGPGLEFDSGLCYPLCPSGFHGAGPVCWQNCPVGYADDGATCRRDATIIGADNSGCPWYDKCGLTFAGGCSVCPSGFNNDGCTCRIDVDIFGKSSSTRGAGGVPNGCLPGLQYDTGLCYQPCGPGFSGVGPVCWGTCPARFDDHGATCYRAPNVFSDD